MDIGFSVGVAAVDTVKTLIKIIRDKQKADPELMTLVNDIMAEVLDMREKYLALYQENEQLKNNAKIELSIVFDEKFGFYRSRESDEKLAYCTKCKAEGKGLIPLKKQDNGFVCKVCNSFYQDPGHIDPYITIVPRRNRFNMW